MRLGIFRWSVFVSSMSLGFMFYADCAVLLWISLVAQCLILERNKENAVLLIFIGRV